MSLNFIWFLFLFYVLWFFSLDIDVNKNKLLFLLNQTTDQAKPGNNI